MSRARAAAGALPAPRKWTEAEIIARHFGGLDQWPVTPDAANNWTQPQIKAIARRMADTGACLWHAMAEMMVWTDCHCADCAPLQRPAVYRAVQGLAR
jgi:hypothetical protein